MDINMGTMKVFRGGLIWKMNLSSFPSHRVLGQQVGWQNPCELQTGVYHSVVPTCHGRAPLSFMVVFSILLHL